ncbi:ArnT family glycosyltransferase [Ottowia testudinis]|uniref:Glycosyltransferase family 39 protein n=1 Tax=Ottowia testudinis TaxID=2816950 RepID=A0A975H252_9BURK|nr:glycosyltransferase family 39 protein [Ottowia testudinis]QTD44508.1 glycosyltransferase family 39 protein [Ottowia testudinis]
MNRALPRPPSAAAGAPATGLAASAPGALFALLLALPLLAGLGSHPLIDVDEGAFSAATRELLASGDWGHTTLNGAPRFDKPILVYWLQAASVALLGLNEWALRLPSALCTWAAALAAERFVGERHGAQSGRLTALILVTAFGPWAMARAATADALLNLLLMLTALDLWRHLESGARPPLRRAAAWAALGLLAKGPIALLVPGAALGLWALSRRDGAALRRALGDPAAWLILIAIAAPWYLYALHRHGMDFIAGFILKHNVGRFTGPMEGHGGSLLYYVLIVPLLWLPWTPLWLRAARHWRALWGDAQLRFWLCWAGFVIVFFSLSGTKLPHYSLYAGPGLLMLTAWALRQSTPGGALRGALWGALALLVLLLGALPWLLQSGAVPIGDALYAALLRGAPTPWAVLAMGAALLVLVALLAAAPGRGLASCAFAPRFATAAWLVALGHGWVVVPWLGEALQGPIQRTALAARALGSDAAVVQWNTHWPSVGVYLQRAVPPRAPQPGELAITRTDRLQRLQPPPNVTLLRQENGVALVRREGF